MTQLPAKMDVEREAGKLHMLPRDAKRRGLANRWEVEPEDPSMESRRETP
ncbi:MAG: hypothetical protein ABSB26_08515 [Nitrososphaerales archaeon]